jgi:hypothetical protein
MAVHRLAAARDGAYGPHWYRQRGWQRRRQSGRWLGPWAAAHLRRWALQAPGKGCVTLIGDAAHPMTPNLGQGGCVSLEVGAAPAFVAWCGRRWCAPGAGTCAQQRLLPPRAAPAKSRVWGLLQRGGAFAARRQASGSEAARCRRRSSANASAPGPPPPPPPPQDSVVLARMLRDAGRAGLLGTGAGAQLAPVLRDFEQQRIRRCLPLTVRSWAFGFALQLPYPPVRGAKGTEGEGGAVARRASLPRSR